MDFPTARLSSPIRWFPLRCCITALPRRDTRLPLSPHCNPPKAPQKMDSLGDFHCSHAASYPLLQAGFQGNRTRTLAGVFGASAPLFTVPTQGRLLCTQRSRHKGRVAPRCRFLAIGVDDVNCLVHRSLTTRGVRLCTTAGLHGSRVGSLMPLRGALHPQAGISHASLQHPPQTGRKKQAPEVSQLCPLKDF